MFLTIYMLLDALEDLDLEEVYIDRKDRIASIRICSEDPEIKEFQENILYLSAVSNESRILCQGFCGTCFYVRSNLFTLTNRIMETIDEFTLWRNRLQHAIHTGCTLTDLLNISTPLIPHPMIILDANMWGIAYSDLTLHTKLNEDWMDLIRDRTSNAQKITAFNMQYYQYYHLRNVYRIPGEIFGEGYAVNLFHDKNFCGVIIMDASLQPNPIKKGELDALQDLGEMIRDMISLNSVDMNIQLPETALFEYLMKQDTASGENLKHTLKSRSWKEDDLKWILYAEALNPGTLAPAPAHTKPIFNRIDGICTTEYKTGLILLCNLRILKNKESAKQLLSDRLEKICYYAGSSSEFYSFSSVIRMVEQAQISIRCSSMRIGSVHEFEDSVVDYVVAILKKNDTGILKHPCLQILQDHDARFGSKLYDTFFCYLKNERKPAKTMEELDIPRSTLLNRLQRIDELLDLSLEQPEVRFHILLSYLMK